MSRCFLLVEADDVTLLRRHSPCRGILAR
ncbi:hypothetical protein [Mesorhizobium sp. M0152]